MVGGGIIGNSVAYHLAQMGMKDVVLLEQQQVTAGTTWHAAGLMVTFGSMNETSTDMRKYTKKLYSELEAETGQATGFKPVGKCSKPHHPSGYDVVLNTFLPANFCFYRFY